MALFQYVQGVNAMSLKLSVIDPVPQETVRIARAAFPKGNLYISIEMSSALCLKILILQLFTRVEDNRHILPGDWR